MHRSELRYAEVRDEVCSDQAVETHEVDQVHDVVWRCVMVVIDGVDVVLVVRSLSARHDDTMYDQVFTPILAV